MGKVALKLGFLGACLLLGSYEFARAQELDLKYRTPAISLNDCQAKSAKSALTEFISSIRKIAFFLPEMNVVQLSMISPAESAFLAKHPLYLTLAKAAESVPFHMSKYCSPALDGTGLNAVSHFGMGALAAFMGGKDRAKKILDLHEANEGNFVGGQPSDHSAMDIYNNYQGIRAGWETRSIPDGKSPQLYFIELGLKMLEEGKLKTVLESPDTQRCLLPKAAGDEPHFSQFMNEPDAGALKRFKLILPKAVPLKPADRKSVIGDISTSDEFYQEVLQAVEHDSCCR